MPQVYHPRPTDELQRIQSASSTSSSSMPSVSRASMMHTDVDDSIVLSDLVRTGEASRLRRRGAMRIDHGPITGSSNHPYTALRPASPTMIISERLSWGSDYDQDSTVLEGHLYRNPSSRFSRVRPRSSRRHGTHDTAAFNQLRDQPDEYVYSLVCGTKLTNFDLDEEVEPFKASILPLYPPLASSSNNTSMVRSTGCGAIVHLHAAPRSRVGMWTARSAAPTAVITLEASYFETREASKFTRSACGCIKEGIGCAVCGNPLGIRYVPCKAESDCFFPCNNWKLHAGASTRPRGPEGPQYWQASSSQSSTDHAIYTFFSHAVTPTPPYNFPPIKSVTRQRTYSINSIPSPSPPTTSQPLPSGTSGGSYADTEETAGVLQLGEEHDRDAGTREGGDVGRPETILDRFSASSPISFLDAGEENAPATTTSFNHDSWDPPLAHWRHHTRSTVTSTSGLNLRAVNDDTNQPHTQYDPESFYQQQILAAWERETDRSMNVDNDGRSGSVLDARWGFDPDGESELWGVVNTGWPADWYDSESADKSTEGPLFPER